jgi:hypothetical protein
VYTRKVKGYKYQLRWWLTGHGSVNCGLYDDLEAAELVRREVVVEMSRHPLTPLGLWQALQVVFARLKQRWRMWSPPRVLPMNVRARPDGGYRAGEGVRHPDPPARALRRSRSGPPGHSQAPGLVRSGRGAEADGRSHSR